MKYESTMNFKGKLESINLETDADYSRITFNRLKFNDPVLDEMFLMLITGETVEIEIKRMIEKE